MWMSVNSWHILACLWTVDMYRHVHVCEQLTHTSMSVNSLHIPACLNSWHVSACLWTVDIHQRIWTVDTYWHVGEQFTCTGMCMSVNSWLFKRLCHIISFTKILCCCCCYPRCHPDHDTFATLVTSCCFFFFLKTKQKTKLSCSTLNILLMIIKSAVINQYHRLWYISIIGCDTLVSLAVIHQ